MRCARASWYQIAFTAAQTGQLREIVLDHVVDWEGRPEDKDAAPDRSSSADGGSMLGMREVQAAFAAQKDAARRGVLFQLCPAG